MTGSSPERQRSAGLGPRSLSRFRLELIREPDDRFQVSGRINVAGLAALAHEVLRGFDREALGAIYLDTKGRPTGYTVAYQGTLSRTAAEPRGLLVPALLANAARLIAFHNHPSGSVEPSTDDLVFTRQLAEAGDALGIEVEDHLILGEAPCFLSLRARGHL